MASINGWYWSPEHQDYYRVENTNQGPTYAWARDQQRQYQQQQYQQQASDSSQYSSSATSYSPMSPSQYANQHLYYGGYLHQSYRYPDSSRGSRSDSNQSYMPPALDSSMRAQIPDLIPGTPARGFYERLDPSYVMQQNPREFFRIGRVFSFLHLEAASEDALREASPYKDDIEVVRFGQHAFSQIRRFIVVIEKQGFCYACPISTYSGRGTLMKGCNPAEHAVVYVKGTTPQILQNEKGMSIDPIAIEPANSSITLDLAARVRLGKLVPIEWNVKVKNLGKVVPEDLSKLDFHAAGMNPEVFGEEELEHSFRRMSDKDSDRVSTAVATHGPSNTKVADNQNSIVAIPDTSPAHDPRAAEKTNESQPVLDTLGASVDRIQKRATQPVIEIISQLMSHVQGKVCHAEFELLWDVDGFVSEELEHPRDLAAVLTLSGTIKDAYATTCDEYIRMFWPDISHFVLKQLLPAITGSQYSEKSFALYFHEDIALKISKSPFKESLNVLLVKVTGSAENIKGLAQVLTWIAAMFRRPKPGQLSYSIPKFERTGGTGYRITILDLQCIDEESLCWSAMFPSGIIAKDFPIPERNNETGLEISFDLMVVLCRIWYPVEYLDGLVLKGYSTILVPTQKTEDSVQWHFISNKNQEEKIGLSSIDTYCGFVLETLDLKGLQSSRTFVGWCKKAISHAGTKASGFKEIRDSQAPARSRRPRLEPEFAPSIGTSGLGFFGGQLGLKIKFPKSVYRPVKDEHALMEDKLLNAKNNPLLVWDEGTRRGWIISEVAAILMIIHVWAYRQTDSESLLQKIPFSECSSEDGLASYQAIREHENVILRSQPSGEAKDLVFGAMVKKFFVALESRKELIIFEEESVPLTISVSSHLTGWEVTDMAYSTEFFAQKKTSLNKKTCGNWPSVLFRKRKEVLTLFCRGVGDLIEPISGGQICSLWTSVPQGHSYLVSTISNLTKLGAFCCTDNCFDDCALDGKTCPSRLQKVSREQPSTSIETPVEGAVIIGKYHDSLRQACSSPTAVRARRVEVLADTPTFQTARISNPAPFSFRPECQPTTRVPGILERETNSA